MKHSIRFGMFVYAILIMHVAIPASSSSSSSSSSSTPRPVTIFEIITFINKGGDKAAVDSMLARCSDKDLRGTDLIKAVCCPPPDIVRNEDREKTDLEMLDLLITKHGIAINEKPPRLPHPTIFAIDRGQFFLQSLLALKADPNGCAANGDTAPIYCMRSTNIKKEDKYRMLELLLPRLTAEDLKAKSSEGRTIESYADTAMQALLNNSYRAGSSGSSSDGNSPRRSLVLGTRKPRKCIIM